MLDVDGKYALFFAALRRPGTGICFCWRITRLDGTELLFTDHDVDVPIQEGGGSPLSGSPLDPNLLFISTHSFAVTATKRQQGLAVDNVSIIGTIDDGGASPISGITEADVLAELYADASIEIWLCAWTDLDAGLFPLKTGTLGEMKFRTTGFEADMRGLTERLQRNVHRVFSISCPEVLGNERCGVNLDGSPPFRETVTVSNVTDKRVFITTLAQPVNWAQYGLATWVTGNNAGLSREIIDHQALGTSPETGSLILLIPMPFDIEVGDQLTITQGCDKVFATCRDIFNNADRFRGFPLIPLVETVSEYPDAK